MAFNRDKRPQDQGDDLDEHTVFINRCAKTVKGIDKQQVGEAAARIRSYYPAEPYKGKGIKYVGEHIRRKQGKKVA